MSIYIKTHAFLHVHTCFQPPPPQLSSQRAIRLLQHPQSRPPGPRAHGQGPRPARLVKSVGKEQRLGEQKPEEVDQNGHAQTVPERLPADGREAVEVIDEQRRERSGGEEGPEEVGVLWFCVCYTRQLHRTLVLSVSLVLSELSLWVLYACLLAWKR